MNIVCVQPDVVWHDPPANRARIGDLLESASPARGDLVVLPEMFATGFTMDASLAEPPDGETSSFLSRQAVERGLYIIAGISTERDNGVFNDAVLFGPEGDEMGRYAKMHSFNPAGEGDVYRSGAEVIVVEVGGAIMSPAVCYDLRFPELFRDAVRRGAEILTVIANWPAPRAAHWHALLQARAIENQAIVAGVNRVGRDTKHEYAGGSVIFDPRGEILARADDKECFICAEIDLTALRSWRDEFPALKDMK
jgi:predicted amidohydrolase